MVVDMKRRYLELRPALARVYVAVSRLAGMQLRCCAPWASGGSAAEVRVGAVDQQPCALDFGPGSVDGWLQRLVLAEAAEPGRRQIADHRRHRCSPSSVAREREVLTVLAEGVTNNELADRLFISERTANRHLSNIFTKLGVRTRTAAARIAIEAGLTG